MVGPCPVATISSCCGALLSPSPAMAVAAVAAAAVAASRTVGVAKGEGAVGTTALELQGGLGAATRPTTLALSASLCARLARSPRRQVR